MGTDARRRDMLSQPGSTTLADSQRQRTRQNQNGEGQMWMLGSEHTTKVEPPFEQITPIRSRPCELVRILVQALLKRRMSQHMLGQRRPSLRLWVACACKACPKRACQWKHVV